MDQVDRATERESEILSDAIGEVRRHTALKYTGCCHNCGDITGGGRRFCDVDCRDDYEKRKKLKGGHAGTN